VTYSVKRYFEIMGANGGQSYFRANQPFDAGYTWTMMDNCFHMLDMMGKVRINWMKSSVDSSFKHGPMVLYFPITMVSPYSYPNFDLRIAAGGGNSEVEVRASIVLPEVQGPVGGVGLGYGVIGQATGTSPISDVEWIIDTTITTGNVDVAPVTFVQAPAFGGDSSEVGNHHFLKLLIEYDYTTSESGPNTSIWAVHLREYPV
jgi:hypothetical protein